VTLTQNHNISTQTTTESNCHYRGRVYELEVRLLLQTTRVENE